MTSHKFNVFTSRSDILTFFKYFTNRDALSKQTVPKTGIPGPKIDQSMSKRASGPKSGQPGVQPEPTDSGSGNRNKETKKKKKKEEPKIREYR